MLLIKSPSEFARFSSPSTPIKNKRASQAKSYVEWIWRRVTAFTNGHNLKRIDANLSKDVIRSVTKHFHPEFGFMNRMKLFRECLKMWRKYLIWRQQHFLLSNSSVTRSGVRYRRQGHITALFFRKSRREGWRLGLFATKCKILTSYLVILQKVI